MDECVDTMTQQPEEDLFRVCECGDSRGNGLKATRNVPKNTLIFKDKPLFQSCAGGTPCCDPAIAPSNCGWCNRPLEDGLKGFPCSGKCENILCSEECRKRLEESGHSWICAAYASGGIIHHLSTSTNDPLGHIRLAFTIYANVLELMFQNPNSTPNEIFAELVAGIQIEDYCRTQHAFRNGVDEVDTDDPDDDMFASLIAPAYFRSYLEAPLAEFKAYFSSPAILSVWVAKGGEAARLDEFLQSDLFTGDMFIRELIGMFVINNLEIRIHSNQQPQRVGTTGTGLYKTYSKMNHSCLCNTRNAVSPEGEVSVYAARDICEGEEITTSYFHIDDPRGISRKARNALLRQYLFNCKCELCTEVGGQPEDSESDGDY